MSSVVTAYIALGSNLQDPPQQIRQAVAALRELPQSQFIRCSSLYRSRPLGVMDQPDYANAVVELQTAMLPEPLLDLLQAIEHHHGRVREAQHWGPRTLDLDIVLYGAQQINTPRLTVPHYAVAERSFVLYPLQEIATPQLVIPGQGLLTDLVAAYAEHGTDHGLELLSTC